jgi:dTMP kinase
LPAGGRTQKREKPGPFRDHEPSGLHRSLREDFLAIAQAEPERCVVAGASKDAQHAGDEVWAIVRKRFSL